MKKLGISIVVLGVCLAAYFAFIAHYTGHGASRHGFYIDEKYDTVKMALIKGHALQTVVEANNGKLLDHQWIDLNINMRKLRPKDWDIEGDGVFWFITRTLGLAQKSLCSTKMWRFTRMICGYWWTWLIPRGN